MDAELQYLSDVASSYASFCPMLITRAFIERFRNRPMVMNFREKHHVESEPIAPSHDFFWVYYDVSYEYIYERYDLDPQDVNNLEKILKRIPFKSMCVSPIFDDLARVDYA